MKFKNKSNKSKIKNQNMKLFLLLNLEPKLLKNSKIIKMVALLLLMILFIVILSTIFNYNRFLEKFNKKL